MSDPIVARVEFGPSDSEKSAVRTPQRARRACEWCGTQYEPYRKWQSFCSAACRRLAWESRHPSLPDPATATDAEIREALRDYLASCTHVSLSHDDQFHLRLKEAKARRAA